MLRRIGLAVAFTATLAAACSGGAGNPESPASSQGAEATAPSATNDSLPASTATPAGPPPSATGPVVLHVASTTRPGLDSKVMESGFGFVWAISSRGLDKVAASGAVSPVITGAFEDIAIGKESIYALKGGTVSELDEIDPSTGEELRHWPLANGARSLALSDSVAFIVHSSYPATVDRVDLSSGSIKTFTVNEMTGGVIKGQALAYGADRLWSSSDGTTIYGLDPTTLTVNTTAHVSTATTSVWFGNGSVWTSGDGYHAGIHRVDPATGSDVADLMNDAIQLAFEPKGVWISATDGPAQIDSSSAKMLAAVPSADAASNYSGGIAVLNDTVFVAYVESGQLQQIEIP
jgi:hypothetical protein